MITEEKIKKARKQLRSGGPEGEIKNELVSEGYTEEDLAKIFKPYRPDMRSWFLVFAIIFLLVGSYRLAIDGGYHFLVGEQAEQTEVTQAHPVNGTVKQAIVNLFVGI